MKLGIIGLPGAGKTTVFEALTGGIVPPGQKNENHISTIRVPDDRIDRLSEMYKPKKTTYAQIEYILPAMSAQPMDRSKDHGIWNQVRDCDGLIQVVRNFTDPGGEAPTVQDDVTTLEQDMMLSDLMASEKRIERLENDRRKGKGSDQDELLLLQRCRECLEQEKPLREFPDLAEAHALKGFAFATAKPMLLLINNEETDPDFPKAVDPEILGRYLVIRGKLEQELMQMSDEEKADFLTEFDIEETAKDRVIRSSYEMMGLLSFFTVGDDEVKAWTIRKETPADDAAGVIHTDMKKGFIRAETVSFDDLMSAGSYAEARKKGAVRLEGKTYHVQDGDVMNVRFNV